MESSLITTSARWRKSSYSGDTNGECVECAPVGNVTWQKSSYSGDTNGECIEVATCTTAVAVRDSKNPDGPVFAVAPHAFTTFVTAAASGDLNRS
ncbi:DUF397 domain-containing protein [Streptomyces sp. NPDC058200]|uniref:DUF397 domain-containing protein n=1 Tax=Streptomyces sp. NPDC058200 TaxID=3346378 RepID=UPI0036E0C91E